MLSVLTIAGSDPTGGAGVQADLKTLFAHGVHGTSAITAVTVQNSAGVQSIFGIPAYIVAGQIRAVFDEFDIKAIKIGMMPSAEVAEAVAGVLADHVGKPIVIDPIFSASAGQRLSTDDAIAASKELLFPLATVITPNCEEASLLSGVKIDSPEAMRTAADRIIDGGCRAVLITGGHTVFAPATDFLFINGGVEEFRGSFVSDYLVHGAGCSFSSAIAAVCAEGVDVRQAVMLAKAYVNTAIAKAPAIGGARRPLKH